MDQVKVASMWVIPEETVAAFKTSDRRADFCPRSAEIETIAHVHRRNPVAPG